MPSWLLWLAPVPLATLAAIAWTAWSGRARGPAEAEDSVAAYERFRAALAPPPGDDSAGDDPRGPRTTGRPGPRD